MNYYAYPGIKGQAIFKGRSIRQQYIIEAVCDHFDLEFTETIKRNRQAKYVLCRTMIVYFLRKHTNLTVKEIGKVFGHDHTTVLHSLQKVRGFMDIKDDSYIDDISKIESKLSML